jgi:hypothetical protein
LHIGLLFRAAGERCGHGCGLMLTLAYFGATGVQTYPVIACSSDLPVSDGDIPSTVSRSALFTLFWVIGHFNRDLLESAS